MVVDSSPFPCMEPDEYARWDEANYLMGPGFAVDGPCIDCSMAYAIEQGERCVRRETPQLRERAISQGVAMAPDLTGATTSVHSSRS